MQYAIYWIVVSSSWYQYILSQFNYSFIHSYTVYLSCFLLYDICRTSQEICPQHICSWWRHQMETFFALLAICAGNSPVPVNSTHKGQWRGALMFSLICVWINGWVNNRKVGDLTRYRAHYDVTVMCALLWSCTDRFCTNHLRLLYWPHGPLILTWIHCNPIIDKYFCA